MTDAGVTQRATSCLSASIMLQPAATLRGLERAADCDRGQ